MKYSGIVRLILALVIWIAALGGLPERVEGAPGDEDTYTYLPLVAKPPELLCRFGVAVPGAVDAAQLKQIRSGAVINWGLERSSKLVREITFLHVIRTGRNYSAAILTDIPALVATYPGENWQIGNEPDTCYESQDCAEPSVYAGQYFAIASALRANDPTAKIGFGSVVQPTPIRRAYLDRAWAELVRLAGGQAQASALVDFWSIHSFMLNEKPGEWGTGIPPGMQSTDAPLFLIAVKDIWKTYNSPIFQQRIRDFRAWMNAKGERNKALWITEYGSLFPPIDPPEGPNLINVSDTDTIAFMLSSFDFLRSATDANTGMPGDGNHLVQRWFWYSFNDYRYKFGGTLFDPATGSITSVGQAYAAYTAPLPADVSCKP